MKRFLILVSCLLVFVGCKEENPYGYTIKDNKIVIIKESKSRHFVGTFE